MKKFNLFLNHFEEITIAIALFIGALMLFINVILRYFFHSGIFWAEELTRFSIIWLTFIGSSVAARKGAHLGVTIIFEYVKNELAQKILKNVVLVIALIFSIFFIVYGMKVTMLNYRFEIVSATLEAPMYIVYSAIPLGGLLMSIRYIQMIIKLNKGVEEQ